MSVNLSLDNVRFQGTLFIYPDSYLKKKNRLIVNFNLNFEKVITDLSQKHLCFVCPNLIKHFTSFTNTVVQQPKKSKSISEKIEEALEESKKETEEFKKVA